MATAAQLEKKAPRLAKKTNPSPDRLKEFPETGRPHGSRVKDLKSLHGLFTQFVRDDETSAYNRRLVRDVAEGAPPFDENDISQDGRFNLNFHDLAALMESAKASYTDLLDSVETIIRVYFPEVLDDLGSNESAEKQEIIAQEYHQMVRHDWPEFDSYWEILINELIQHGVGFSYFPDEFSWKWTPAGWDEALMPRQTKATEESVNVLFFRDPIEAHQLYASIEDEDSARKAGWNVEECRRQLVTVTRGVTAAKAWDRKWSEVQDELANNDLGTSYKAETVKSVHALVREFDGTYSHYIFPEDGSGETFLFKRLGRYESAVSSFTIFVSNVGRNGKYHAARGLLYKAYPFVQTLNRLNSGTLDSTSYSLATFLQPTNAESMEDMAITLDGPIGWLPPEAQLVAGRTFPDISKNALPVIQYLERKMNRNLGQYRTIDPDKEPAPTRYGQRARQETEGVLTASAVSKFYRSWGRLCWEQFRRVQKIGPNNRKFPEVQAFYRRLALRGVSADEVKMIDRVEPYRAAGFGSPGLRSLAFDEAMESIGMLDEVGRKNLLRDRMTNRFGVDMANRYVGRQQKPRFVFDERIAELENSGLKDDPGIQAMPGENSAVHAPVHLGRAAKEIAAIVDAFANGEELNPQQMLPVLDYIQRLLTHVQPHLQELAGDQSRRELFGQLRKMFQQIAAQWDAARRNLQRMGPAEDQQLQALSKLDLKMAEHRQKMQNMVEQSALERRLRAEEASQKIQIRRMTSDVNLASRVRESD